MGGGAWKSVRLNVIPINEHLVWYTMPYMMPEGPMTVHSAKTTAAHVVRDTGTPVSRASTGDTTHSRSRTARGRSVRRRREAATTSTTATAPVAFTTISTAVSRA